MRGNKHLLLYSSLVTLLALGWAAFEENWLQGWRQAQREYAARLPLAAAHAFAPRLRQIVAPAVSVLMIISDPAV